MDPRPNDPVIDEIREVRHRISERANQDPARLVAYYIELQERYLLRDPCENDDRAEHEPAVVERLAAKLIA